VAENKIKEGSHVGLDFYDLLIEELIENCRWSMREIYAGFAMLGPTGVDQKSEVQLMSTCRYQARISTA